MEDEEKKTPLAEFLKTVGFVGFSNKKLFGPTGDDSTFHCFVR